MTESKPLQIFNASAGSGKTYTLVQEYLRIVLHSKNPMKFRSILAMTFTNKAANEMKERIIDGLIQLVHSKKEGSEDALSFLIDTSKNLQLNPSIVIERSEKILNSILHNYSSFSVMTIDKFTHKIIRTFAKDLNISMDFDVELDMDKLRKSITDLIFDKIGRDPSLTQLMLAYAKSNLSDDKSWNFSEQLQQFSQNLFKENAHHAIELLRKLKPEDFLKVREDLVKENKIISNKIEQNAQEAFDLIRQKNLTPDDLAGKSHSVYGLFKRLAAGAIDSGPTKTHKNNAANDKWAHKDSVHQHEIEEIAPLLAQYFKQIEAVYAEEYPTFLLNREILKNLNNLSLLNNLMQLVEDVKEEENVLLISDFYRKIAEVITEEPVPFIYERLGVRYSHFLLDEFQDTSQMQWMNTIPLLHNSLASENTNLIVGDGKQAIYRWRNGDVEQFTNLPDKVLNPQGIASLTEAEPLFRALGERKTLSKNFRSADEIVDFNNAFFNYQAKQLPPSLQPIYEKLEQKAVKGYKGYIEGDFTEDQDLDDQLAFISKAIQNALDANYEYRDICILTRKNKDGATVSRYLTEHGIKVISPDSLFIGKDRSVKLLVNLMGAIINPSYRNYKLKTLEHFCFLIRKEDPKAFLNAHQELVQTKNMLQIMEHFGYELSQPKEFHNLFEFVERLIHSLNLKLGENPFLQFLLEQVHLFEKFNNSSLRDFLDWYEDRGHKTSIISPEGADAVQVMTIHKSKGLQFPVVIFPFVDWRPEPHRQETWVEQDYKGLPAFVVNLNKNVAETELASISEQELGKIILDDLNLLYVAFTRAERALFMCGDGKKSGSISKNMILPFFAHAPEINLENQTFKIGRLNPIDKIAHEKGANYPITFHGAIMNKPVLSYKSAENWDFDDMDIKRLFGTKVHLILSEINQEEDLNEVLNAALKKGKIDTADYTDIQDTIINLFKDAHFSAYFNDGKQINEQEIIDGDGKKLIPDKIIVRKNETVIVDFKTGHWAPSHKKQVITYKKVLSDLGYSNVVGEIYYTETQKVVRV